MIKNFGRSISDILFSNIFLLLCCFFIVTSFIRFDAELIIFFSVFFVVLSVWNNLSSFIGKFLFIKVTLYYYYFVRYYQGRLWLVYLLQRYLNLYIFSKRLPYFLKWFSVYEKRFHSLIGTNFFQLNSRWDNLLNYFFYFVFVNSLIYLWTSFYRLNISHYLYTTFSDLFFQDNLRKVSEYVLLNKIDLI